MGEGEQRDRERRKKGERYHFLQPQDVFIFDLVVLYRCFVKHLLTLRLYTEYSVGSVCVSKIGILYHVVLH